MRGRKLTRRSRLLSSLRLSSISGVALSLTYIPYTGLRSGTAIPTYYVCLSGGYGKSLLIESSRYT